MNQALALLILAMQLLTTVNNTPNLPPSYIAAAQQIATLAINDAEAELSTSSSTPVVSNDTIQAITESATDSTPLAGSIDNMADENTQPTPQPTLSVSAAYLFSPVSTAYPYGVYAFDVTFLDSTGTPVPHASITMTDPSGNEETRNADTVNGIGGKNYHATFLYTPEATGTEQFTFTSGELTQDATITI